MSPDESNFIPTDPQEYLNLVELLEHVHGRSISYETHLLLITAVCEAIAAIDFEEKPVSTAVVLSRVDSWLEFALAELPTVQDPQAVRLGIRGLRASIADWQRHFRERPERTSDSE